MSATRIIIPPILGVKTVENPTTGATPPTLKLDHRNVLTWDRRVNFPGTSPHSIITTQDFSSKSARYFGSNRDDLISGDGTWLFTTASGAMNTRVELSGRCAGPSWVMYVIVEEMSTPASGVNILDVGVNYFNGVTSTAKAIFARLWRTEARCDVHVNISQNPSNGDSGEWGLEDVTLPEGAFSLALICNLNSLAVAIGDGDGRNFRIASGWHTLTEFDMSTDEILFGNPGADGNGGLPMQWYCESATEGSVFKLSKAEWAYWDGVGTRETYLMSDIEGRPIVENGKVWVTTDRTLPFDTAENFLPNGAQVIACQYNPSNGRLELETSRFFYKIDGRTTGAQNSKFVWDLETNSFHCYIPDWKESPGYVGMLYAHVDYADIRFGTHIIQPVALTLPTGAHFSPDLSVDSIFDASMVRIAKDDYLFLVTWVDISRGFPDWYSRAMFRGTAPDTFTEIVGWDDAHGGEGHRIVRVGGKLWAICGSLDRTKFHTWEIIPGGAGANWMSYVSETLIPGFDWGHGDEPSYPAQAEIFGMPSSGGMVYHFTTFGVGSFDPETDPDGEATQGSFFSARSQEFPIT